MSFCLNIVIKKIKILQSKLTTIPVSEDIVKLLNCDIVIRKFDVQLDYYDHFQPNKIGIVWTNLTTLYWL